MSPSVVQVGPGSRRVPADAGIRRGAAACATGSRRAVGARVSRRGAVVRVAVSRRASATRADGSLRGVCRRGAVDRAAVSRRVTCVKIMRSPREEDATVSRARAEVGRDVFRGVAAAVSRRRAGVLGEVFSDERGEASWRGDGAAASREGADPARRVRGRGAARGGIRPDATLTGEGSIRLTSAAPTLTAESVPAGYSCTATAYSRGRTQTQREPPATVPAAPHSTASKRTATGYGLVFSTTRCPAEWVRFVSIHA